MKVCYLLTHNPETTGGIETVVKNLAKDSDTRAVWIGCGGACSIIKGFFTALRLRFSDYDIIHAHDNASYWLTWLARNKKIAWTAQGLWKNYFEENPPAGLKKSADAWVLKRMQNRIIKNSDIVIPINIEIEKELRQHYNIQPAEIIRNGVDTKNFKPLKSEKEFDYIWVSTNPKKACLAECIKYSDGKKMLAVGVGGKDTKKIKYTKASREAMPRIYNSARALIYFSRQKDYSLAILEAMACGLDIITNESIIRELTEEGRPAGTVDLTGRMEKIIFVDGKTARKIALSMDWSVVRARYKKIHEKLVSGVK